MAHNIISELQNNNTITFGQVNICGLSAYSSLALNQYAKDSAINILAVSEVKYEDPVILQEYNDPILEASGKENSGGAALYIHRSIQNTTAISSLQGDHFESAWALCEIGKKTLLTGSVYVHHDNPRSLQSFIKSLELAGSFCSSNGIDYMYIMGDFNTRHPAWQDNRANKQGEVFLDFLNCTSQDLYLISPNELTFLCPDDGGSVIDLAICNTATKEDLLVCTTDKVYHLGTGAPSRGHIPVLAVLNVKDRARKCRQDEPKWVYDMQDVDWKDWAEKLDDLLRDKATELECCQDNPQDLANLLEKFLFDNCDSVLTKKRVCKFSKPYWTSELSYLAAKVNIAAKIFKKKSSFFNKAVMDVIKEEYQTETAKQINLWIDRETKELNHGDLQDFWARYKKYFTHRSSSEIGILRNNGKLITANVDKADLLSKTFFHRTSESPSFDNDFKQRIETEVDGYMASPTLPADDDDPLNSEYTMTELQAALHIMKTNNKSPDNHGLHPVMIKNVGPLFRVYLLELFNAVFSSRKWIWRTSKVIFIKKKKKSLMDPSSYRPLCLNSYIGKTMERLMEHRMRNLAERKGLIDDNQEGFRKQRSTHRYLYKLKAKLAICKLQRTTGICMAVDFEKAFDSVWVKGLLYKLWLMGIKGNMWHLLADLLLHRSVKLYVNTYISDIICCILGLPQGSILAPLLFILFIADMPLSEVIDQIKYADDMTALIIARTLTEARDTLQDHCNRLAVWCNTWRMTINCNKGKTECIKLDFRPSSSQTEEQVLPVTINNKEISFVEKSPILGVIIDSKLSNTPQCEAVKNKLVHKWWNVKKYINPNWGLKLKTTMTIINATILPNLFYAAPSWMTSRSNIDHFKVLTYQILSVACGARYKPERSTLECMTGFLPIETQLRMITTKFLIKNYVQHIDDSLTDTITRSANTARHFTVNHINDLKRYYAHHMDVRSPNTIDLYSSTVVSHSYSKTSIKSYAFHCWNNTLINNPPSTGICPNKELKAINLPCSRKIESFILSLIHGHNVLNNFRYRRALTISPLCLCGLHETADHLLHCSHLANDPARTLEQLEKACADNKINYTFPAIVNSRNQDVFAEVVKHVKRLFVIRPDIPGRDLRVFS